MDRLTAFIKGSMAHLEVPQISMKFLLQVHGFRHNKNTLIVMELNIFQLRNKKQKRYSCFYFIFIYLFSMQQT